MDNLVVNSCLAILNFKKSSFEERVKTAAVIDKISSKIKEFFDRYGSDELVVILRYKQSTNGGTVELRPFVPKIINRKDLETGKLKRVMKFVPAEEGETTLDTVFMTPEEYNNYIESEERMDPEMKGKMTPEVVRELGKDYSKVPINLYEEEQTQRTIDKLDQPGTILVSDIKNKVLYLLTDIVKTDEGVKYELSDIHTDEKRLISRKEMKLDFRLPQKYRKVLKELVAEKEKEKAPEENILTLDTERYEEIRNLLNEQLEKEKSGGKERTPQEIEDYVNGLLEKEGIPQSKFWNWLEEEEAFLESEKENEFERDTADIEKYRDVVKYVKDKVDKAKANGKPVTQDGINRFISKVLEQRGIKEYKFWEWQDEVRERAQSKKLKTIASILGTTLIKTADFLTELNPDEKKPAFDEETNKEVTVDKGTTTEGRPVVTISDKDNTEKKTYDQNSPELKNITDDLSQIIAFTSEQRVVLAELGYTV